MGNAIGTILPYAIGVDISLISIIAVILMLFSGRARSNGPAFLAGWVLALAVVGSMVLVLANLGKVSTGGTPSTLAYVVKLLLGRLFLLMAIRQWRVVPRKAKSRTCQSGWRPLTSSLPDGLLDCLPCWQG